MTVKGTKSMHIPLGGLALNRNVPEKNECEIDSCRGNETNYCCALVFVAEHGCKEVPCRKTSDLGL